MIGVRGRASDANGSLFLNCPRCGLSIKPRARRLAIEQCPRCLARARVSVTLFSSPLPAEALYAEGRAPGGDREGPVTAVKRGGR